MPQFPEPGRPTPDETMHVPEQADVPGDSGPGSASQPTAPIPTGSAPAGSRPAVAAADGWEPSHTPFGPGGAGEPQGPGAGGPGGPFGPTPGAAPAGGGSSGNTDTSGSGRLIGTALGSALLAAVLASAGTYGVVRANGGSGGTVETGNKTVINADPSEFADAGTVNWSATAAKVNPSVVAITVMAANGTDGDRGSGVILDEQGNIVTNNHVVAAGGRGGQVAVSLSNNRTYAADVVGTDPGTDLAVIRIKNAHDLKPVQLGDDSKLVVGQPVMAVGNPLGLAGTVTTGIVSALDRPVKTAGNEDSSSSSSNDNTVFTNAIQTSAAINPGNSGGALVDGSGKLIGINSSIASLSSSASGGQSGNIGIGFAIPTVVVKNITGQLIRSGKAEHALLGVSTKDAAVMDGGSSLSAARVMQVKSNGAAGKAGIKTGDEIIAIDGEAVTSSDALVGAVRARTVGSTVKVTVLRNGNRQNIQVTLGAKESQ